MEVARHGHLGGYGIGGDPATYYPELWEWTVREFGIRSVVDIGCGDGQSTKFFKGLGPRVLGIDGVPQHDPEIEHHDYSTGPLVLTQPFDLGWCCEFVEHVASDCVENFLATFRAVEKVLLLTHAFPGQDGYHHVNCQPTEYWVERVTSIGFVWDEALTNKTRELARLNQNPFNHFARSGLAFRPNRLQDTNDEAKKP